MNNEIIIYTDGACFGNPGPGGWAAILIWGNKRKELSSGYRLTTNNRMEILAAVEAINAIKSHKKYNIILYSDSRLLVNAFNQGWLEKWQAKGWMRNNKEKVLNPDLWSRLLEAISKHNVTFEWVEGHAGNPENERCDFLSKQTAGSKNLLIDENYEKENENKMWI